MGEVKCYKCGKKYKRLGGYWGNGCEYPEFTPRQREIGMNLAATFSADETERIFEYIDDPIPSFEYKWPMTDYSNH